MFLKFRYIKIYKAALAAFFCFAFFAPIQAQEKKDFGSLSGNFQINSQYYIEDSIIGAPKFPEKLGNNSFLYLNYNLKNFKAGVRMESYMPALQGFTREKGAGFSHRFAEYSHEKFGVTVGTFYEQFGTGMILRSYEEWGLGFDNSLDGVRVVLNPIKGISLKGILGRQRNAFSPKLENLSEGIVRGGDADIRLNELIPGMDTIKAKVSLGGSFVSRFQADNDPVQILPENVAAYSGRIRFDYEGVSLFSEVAHKINDPSSVNSLIYKPGSGFLVQANYSTKGLGISLAAKRVDNMDFRSERAATFNNLNLNFLPPQTKQHTYRLPTLFPWASQTMGEWGFQGEVLYTIKKRSKIGGKYGTTISFNFSRIHDIQREAPTDPDMGYSSNFFGIGDLFFQDINLEISRKFNKKWKGSFTYMMVDYEKNLFQQLTGLKTKENVKAHVQVLDVLHKFNRKHSLRTELQHSFTKQEFGSWAMLLMEYNFSPVFFVALFDEWNYGNANPDLRLHYMTATTGFTLKDYRISLGYGRQRAGVLCVGGVCRVVPASNGVTLSVSGNF